MGIGKWIIEMPGNRAGGLKAKATLLKKFGSPEALHEHFQKLGHEGGKHSKGGSFDKVPGLAERAGALGGAALRRTKANKPNDYANRGRTEI